MSGLFIIIIIIIIFLIITIIIRKSEQGMGSGVAVFTGKVLTEQLKFKLDNRCCNNQAQQLAIVKALEVIQTQQVHNNEHGTAVI